MLAWRWSAFIRTHTHACCTHALSHMYSYTVSHVTDALAQGVVLVLLVQQSAKRASDMRLHTHACATAYVLMPSHAGAGFFFWSNKVHRGPATSRGEERLVLFVSWSAWMERKKKKKRESAPSSGGHAVLAVCGIEAAYVSIRQHTSAYCQHTSAYVSIRGEVGLILRMYV